MEKFGAARIQYHGIDSSAALLDRAKSSLTAIDARLIQRDLVENPPDPSLGEFDLVALFGVLHHIPGADRRVSLLRSLAACVAPGGLLVFTEWRFYEVPALRERILAWDASLHVEPGDYLLDWRRGATALRYCHDVDDAEHERLVAATGLTLVETFRADAANLYTILRAPEK
jgi:SAM-dependent methyltransferase